MAMAAWSKGQMRPLQRLPRGREKLADLWSLRLRLSAVSSPSLDRNTLYTSTVGSSSAAWSQSSLP